MEYAQQCPLCVTDGDMHPLQGRSGSVRVRLLGDMRFHVLGNIHVTGTLVGEDDASLIKTLLHQFGHGICLVVVDHLHLEVPALS